MSKNSKDYKLGEIKEISLDAYWEREDKDFTPWLAENLHLISQAIGGMQLQRETEEKNIGIFRADIVCKDLSKNSWVVIENQYKKSDHKHLGQLLTYAAGLDLGAVTVIWIAEKLQQDHRAALTWLNQTTEEKFSFYGLEVKLKQIDDHKTIAPEFIVVAEPNKWVRKVAKEIKKIDDRSKSFYLDYWQAFEKYVKAENPNINSTKASNYYAQYYAGMTRNILLYANLKKTLDTMSIEIQISGGEKLRNKAIFRILEENKDKIHEKIGQKLEWSELPEVKYSKIILEKKVNNHKDESARKKQFKWLYENLEKIREAFEEPIKNIKDKELEQKITELDVEYGDDLGLEDDLGHEDYPSLEDILGPEDDNLPDNWEDNEDNKDV